MNNLSKKILEDLNNYDIKMIIDEESFDNKDFTIGEIINNEQNLYSHKIVERDFFLLEESKINFSNNNHKNDQTKILNLKNENYFQKMDLIELHNKPSNELNKSEKDDKKQTESNINISYNENDLNEIYDAKQAKNKILCCELLNFIEVFIHSVLYLRRVYPQDAFQNFIIYNLNLKFITDPDISEYISEFLENLENLMLNNLLKRITINIIEPESKKILEFFSMNIEINEFYNDLVYSDICLHLKSMLYKFQNDYANKKELYPQCNKSFNLSIETYDSKIFSAANFKTFRELNKVIEDNFVIEYFSDMNIKLLANKEICNIVDHVNFNITISRNFI